MPDAKEVKMNLKLDGDTAQTAGMVVETEVNHYA